MNRQSSTKVWTRMVRATGYLAGAFNQAIKRNKERFPEDF
jgi:hypothetical protein